MLDPLALVLATEKVTKSDGPDGLAAFDAGTSSMAAAATRAAKPRRFLRICGLLAWRKLPWLPTTTPWRRRLRETTLGASSLRRLCSEAHRPARRAGRSPGRVAAAPGASTRLLLRRRGGCAALQALLEPDLILGDVLARVAARDRREELPDEAVAHEVELERDARARAVVEPLDGHRALRADRAVEPTERSLPRRGVLGDIVGDLMPAAGDAPLVDCGGCVRCRAAGTNMQP